MEQIKKSFRTDTPIPLALHDAAMRLYRQYLVVGGMPECVMQFAEDEGLYPCASYAGYYIDKLSQ